MKKQIIHSRPLLFIFLAFGLGIYFARPIYTCQIWATIFFLLSFITITVLCIRFKYIKRLLCITIAICVGMLSGLLTDVLYVQKHYDGEHIVSGRVMASKVYDYSSSLVIDNVFVDGSITSDNFSVIVFNTSNVEVGDTISFKSKIGDVTLFTLKNFNSYFYNNNIKHTASIDFDEMSIIKSNDLSIAEKIRLSVKNLLNNNMEETEASVCYASLFGDKSDIPSQIKNNFSVSSQAHLLAVSGLHVGFLIAFISKLLSKLKLKNILKLTIIIGLLGFYCYLCSFASSVMRASIMFFILSIGGLLGRQYDRLNAWSVAGLCLLIIRPMYVLDLGFLLSFSCIFCIIVFVNPVKRLLLKMHLPKFLASFLSVSVPIQLGLLPLLAISYSKISLLGMFASVITVPIFEVAFVLLFTFTFICLLLPFLSFILKLPMIIMHLIIWFVGYIANINWAIVNLSRFTGIFVISLYASFFINSKIINMGKNYKVSIIASILAVGFILSSIMTNRVSVTGTKFAVISSYGSNAYYVEMGQNSYFIGNFNNNTINQSKNFLNSSCFYDADYYISFSKNTPLDNTYFKNIYNSENILSLNDDVGSNIKIIKLNNKIAGIILQNQNKCIFFCKNQIFNDGLCMDFAQNYPEITMIVGKSEYVMQYSKFLKCDLIIDNQLSVDGKDQTIQGNYMFDYNIADVSNLRSIDWWMK